MKKKLTLAILPLALLTVVPLAAAPDRDSQLISAIVFNDPEKASELLAAGVSPNATDSNGYTALMWAAEHNRFEMAKLLLERGADASRKDKQGRDATYHARFYPQMVALLKGANATAGVGSRDQAARPEKPTARQGASGQQLVEAALVRDPAKVAALLAAGANPNFQDSQGYTALMRAAAANDAESVKLLLAAGADPNLRNKNGFNAATYGNSRIQELLKNAGAVAPTAADMPVAGQPNYCRAMYTRSYSLCGSSSSCKIIAADKWNTCKRTDEWP